MSAIGIYHLWMSSPALMSVLFFCSVLLAATVFERWWCYGGPSRSDTSLCGDVQSTIAAGNLPLAVQQAGKSNSFIARALLEITVQLQSGRVLARQEFEDLWQIRKEEAAEIMRSRLVVFSTLSFVSPLLGLMGSVLGIHHSFHSIALTGMGGPSVVAAGVSEALLCTLVGVAVAIPAMVMHNAFASVLSKRLAHWDRVGYKLLLLVCTERRPHEGSSGSKAGKEAQK